MDDRNGPLPALLLVLTGVSGLVDAVSYLALGHVFVANMTGNIVFLGFAVADAAEFSIALSLVAIAAFLVGALAGGAIGSRAGHHRARLLAITTFLQIALVGSALLVLMVSRNSDAALVRHLLIVLLSLAMGMQNATARRLGVPDRTTTTLTRALTEFAADSMLAGEKNPHSGRHMLAIATLFLGAAVGAFLVLHVNLVTVLALAFALLAWAGIASYRHWSSSEPWTIGT